VNALRNRAKTAAKIKGQKDTLRMSWCTIPWANDSRVVFVLVPLNRLVAVVSVRRSCMTPTGRTNTVAPWVYRISHSAAAALYRNVLFSPAAMVARLAPSIVLPLPSTVVVMKA
jgi:hypothetical protein